MKDLREAIRYWLGWEDFGWKMGSEVGLKGKGGEVGIEKSE